MLRGVLVYIFQSFRYIAMKFGVQKTNIIYFYFNYMKLHFKHIYLGSGHFYYANHVYRVCKFIVIFETSIKDDIYIDLIVTFSNSHHR